MVWFLASQTLPSPNRTSRLQHIHGLHLWLSLLGFQNPSSFPCLTRVCLSAYSVDLIFTAPLPTFLLLLGQPTRLVLSVFCCSPHGCQAPGLQAYHVPHSGKHTALLSLLSPCSPVPSPHPPSYLSPSLCPAAPASSLCTCCP